MSSEAGPTPQPLRRGDQVPHFEVTTVDRRVVAYSTMWQRHNLVLVRLPMSAAETDLAYIIRLTERESAFTERNARCVMTRDSIDGLPAPGMLIADRWGEITYVSTPADARDLPPREEIFDWLDFIERKCPECEGESK